MNIAFLYSSKNEPWELFIGDNSSNSNQVKLTNSKTKEFDAYNWQKPQLIGLAHSCQKVDALPIESWDVPLKTIITPDKIYHW